MQTETQPTITPEKITKAIAASQNYLLSQQYPQGYWWAELESNVTITSEAVLLHKIWGSDTSRLSSLAKVEEYLRSQQVASGGWELFYGDGGELSTSVEAYMALRLLGVSVDDSVLVKGREFILAKGGISKTRIFTKLHLALIGCYDWRGVPSIPAWIMLLPDNFPFTIYEMSSWARSSTVPLLIVFDKKPVYELGITLKELYTEENISYELPKNGDWTDIFVWLDDLFKLTETLNLVPWREMSLKAAEEWVLTRQEATGDWGGIIPAMLNSLLALRSLDYSLEDPIVQRGLTAVDNFAIETETTYRVQPCISPVWDTAWVIRSLTASGIASNHPAVVKAGEWLLNQQILDYGDWKVKNKQGQPGGWAFEFVNRFYPDVDDSAVVVMALQSVTLPNQRIKQGAINRGVAWIESMQCQEGGWGAFDVDNNQNWLNYLPYADLKAMIDPNTADVTARVLEMLGSCSASMNQGRVKRAIAYLLNEQETDGSWFGRWGVNYIYGTSGALCALQAISSQQHTLPISRGANWLISCQNPDGGWGETCLSYDDPRFKGQGNSTASQTAWAILGLLAATKVTGESYQTSLSRGVNYLVATQLSDGRWEESEFTGTGFPSHFYLKYHFYQQYFPLLALGNYRQGND